MNESESEIFLKHKEISKENFNWLKASLKQFHETENYFFSHAGLNPNKPKSDQTKRDYLWTFYDGSLIHLTNQIVVQGHIHKNDPYIFDNHIVVDTNCGLGGYLTGIVLPEMKFIHSKTKSEYGSRYGF
jgi:serine/threonine protein phosphatase 1